MKTFHRGLREGFTLIETLIAVAVFAVLVTVAIGGFAQLLRTQRQANALIFVNTNASEVIEQMSREIRVGKNFCNDKTSYCGDPSAPYPLCDDTGTVQELAFNVNREGKEELVIYKWTTPVDPDERNPIEKEVWRYDATGVCTPFGPDPVTASNVWVEDVRFTIGGNNMVGGAPVEDDTQPRIFISVSIRPMENTLSGLRATTIQTTVSSRQMDT